MTSLVIVAVVFLAIGFAAGAITFKPAVAEARALKALAQNDLHSAKAWIDTARRRAMGKF